jgi:hypothetical protein
MIEAANDREPVSAPVEVTFGGKKQTLETRVFGGVLSYAFAVQPKAVTIPGGAIAASEAVDGVIQYEKDRFALFCKDVLSRGDASFPLSIGPVITWTEYASGIDLAIRFAAPLIVPDEADLLVFAMTMAGVGFPLDVIDAEILRVMNVRMAAGIPVEGKRA